MNRKKTIIITLVTVFIVVAAVTVSSAFMNEGKYLNHLKSFLKSSSPSQTRPESAEYKVWLEKLMSRLPITATLKEGTTSSFAGTQSVTYRVYEPHIELKNLTNYSLETGNSLYLIETARKEAGDEDTKKLLRVAGGYFRESPSEDFSGVVEFRGETNSDETFGLYNTQSLTASGVISRRLGPVFQITFGKEDKEFKPHYGTAGRDQKLIIDAELQLAVMVVSERLDKVFVITPVLHLHDKKDESASFRYVLQFRPESQEKEKIGKREWEFEKALLLSMTEETLLPLVNETEGPLWRRVFAAFWAGKYAGSQSGSALVSILSAKGKENDALRRAAILGLGEGKYSSALEQIIAVFEDKTEHRLIKFAAIQALGKLADKRATPLLISVAGGKDEDFAKSSIEALGESSDKSAVEPLLSMLENNKLDKLHSNIADVLRKLADNSHLDALVKIASQPKAMGAPEATRAIGGIESPEAVSALVTLSSKGQEEVRQTACQELAESDTPEVLNALKTACVDPAAKVRQAAIQAIAKIDNKDRKTALKEALQNPNGDVQENAVKSLVKLEVNEAYPEIAEILQNKKVDQSVRVAAAKALGEIKFDAAVESLIPSLKDEFPKVRKAAAEALGKIGDSRAVEHLIGALQDQDIDVRSEAAKALGELKAPESIEPLIEALKDKNYLVSSNASSALKKITGEDFGKDYEKWYQWWQQKK